MATRIFHALLGATVFALLTLSLGCERSTENLRPASFPVNGNVFRDGFSGGLEYSAFGGSDNSAFEVVDEGAYEGASVMRFSVPRFNDPKGAYAGGAFFDPGGRDLSGFTVLTFWAKATKAANLDILGFGNDLGENTYVATINNTPVNTNWRKYYIPIPDPSKLTGEKGMFFYSEGPEDGEGYTFWIDEVRFENLGTIAQVGGTIFNGRDSVITAETGNTFSADGFSLFNLPDGTNQRVETSSAYFTFTSSNPQVATVSAEGIVTVMQAGETTITAMLGDQEVEGSLTITSTGAPVRPLTAAPEPTQPAEDVISIYSNAYNNEPIDFLNGFWEFSTTQSEEIQVDGNDIFRYSQLNFVGIQFTAPTIDVSEMTHFHMDIWTPDPTATAEFIIELVDLGPDGTFDGNDNAAGGVTLSSPALQTESWVSIDLPLSDFTGLFTRQNLAQIVLSGGLPNVFVDNIYFYDDGSGGGSGGGGNDDLPPTAAPTPTVPAADVISLFSDAYPNEPLDFINGFWEFSTTQSRKVAVQGDSMIEYSQLNFVGMEFTNPTIDVSQMNRLHVDIWTPNSTAPPAEFKILLRDFGPNGVFDENGDDTFHELVFTSPTLQTESWVSLDIPLADFTGLTGRSNMAQIVFSTSEGDLNTVFVDNVYFYAGDPGGGGGNDDLPTTAAPAPTEPAANVISIFSDAYADEPLDFINGFWEFSTTQSRKLAVQGDSVIEYTQLNFVGMQFTNPTINVSSATHLHVDLWTPNSTGPPAEFKILLRDFGPNGVFDQNGDDTFHELTFTSPTLQTEAWVSFDIPLSDFTGLTGRSNMAQLVFSTSEGDLNTVFVDNVYFYN